MQQHITYYNIMLYVSGLMVTLITIEALYLQVIKMIAIHTLTTSSVEQKLQNV